MLKLINICKSYKFGKNKFLVLDNINIDFKKHEMVFILGKSGSGKSTLLNIIGGMLEVDSGKIMLDERDITKLNNNMLCNYRNNMIGYIFQDYHLIEYMNVLDNIKLGMTIRNERSHKKIEEILKRLGIYNKRKMLVNRLSGGERQRVAIARAIINNPDIILCDEPTGALDSVNSIKIMDILKELSKEKLVIVVSHDNLLANKYADRVINMIDGKVDYYPQIDNCQFKKINKRRIRLLQIIKLAIKNLWLKKGRTFFTSITISIGLICMLLVLCLSKSFNNDIDKLESDIVSVFPISIYNGEFEIVDSEVSDSKDQIIIKNKEDYIHTNKITNSYIEYIDSLDKVNYISYDYDLYMPIISDRYKIMDNGYMKMIPDNSYLLDNYELLYGRLADSVYDIVLKVDSNNNVDSELLNLFNIDSNVDYDRLIGRRVKVILNDLYYVKNGDYYYINNDYEKLYKKSDIELEIVGIVREKEIVNDSSYFYYDKNIIDMVINNNSSSKIVVDQLNSNYNLLGLNISKEDLLSFLGYKSLPVGINIYVSSLENKDFVLNRLNEYNINNEKLIYVDSMKDAIDILKNVINIITIILVIFSMISILVSGLMIFILTNNRVFERVREIGILISLGARRSDVSKLFNIENMIIGIISSLIGIITINLLVAPINILMESLLGESGIFSIHLDLVIIGVLFNILIVFLSGYIPTKKASRKRIVDCFSGRI